MIHVVVNTDGTVTVHKQPNRYMYFTNNLKPADETS